MGSRVSKKNEYKVCLEDVRNPLKEHVRALGVAKDVPEIGDFKIIEKNLRRVMKEIDKLLNSKQRNTTYPPGEHHFWSEYCKICAISLRKIINMKKIFQNKKKKNFEIDEESRSMINDIREMHDVSNVHLEICSSIIDGEAPINRRRLGQSLHSYVNEFFKCLICHLPAQNPRVCSNCSKVVGCEPCINNWLQTNRTCPHCREDMSTRIILKGSADIVSLLRQNMQNDNED